MQIDLDTQSEIVNVPAIPAGESEWVNHSMIAPSSGTHDIAITLDLDDAVVEADEDNTFLSSVTVDTRMDITHFGDLSITVGDGDLQGPWTISGTIVELMAVALLKCPCALKSKTIMPLTYPTYILCQHHRWRKCPASLVIRTPIQSNLNSISRKSSGNCGNRSLRNRQFHSGEHLKRPNKRLFRQVRRS